MKKGKKRMKWFFIYLSVFLLAFIGSAVIKLTHKPSWSKTLEVKWDDSVGKSYTDITYAEKAKNTFDLYLPKDQSKTNYSLVVYLHAGGFTSGDKADDKKMLQWLAAKGYVAAEINYTLRDENNPNANIYTQSLEIKNSMPKVIEKAKKLGYPIQQMAISGGSAGHTFAMLYAYRDAATSPVPVKMVFGAVGPSSFYPQDWSNYGFNKNDSKTKKAAAGLFSVMSGEKITPELFHTKEYDKKMKNVSTLLWVNEQTVPSLMAYSAYDKVQSFAASKRLNQALKKYKVPHDYIVFPHSGHGLQNDDAIGKIYYQKIEEYLIPVN